MISIHGQPKRETDAQARDSSPRKSYLERDISGCTLTSTTGDGNAAFSLVFFFFLSDAAKDCIALFFFCSDNPAHGVLRCRVKVGEKGYCLDSRATTPFDSPHQLAPARYRRSLQGTCTQLRLTRVPKQITGRPEPDARCPEGKVLHHFLPDDLYTLKRSDQDKHRDKETPTEAEVGDQAAGMNETPTIKVRLASPHYQDHLVTQLDGQTDLGDTGQTKREITTG